MPPKLLTPATAEEGKAPEEGALLAAAMAAFADAEVLGVGATQEALAALIPEIEQLALKVHGIFCGLLKDSREAQVEAEDDQHLRFFTFAGAIEINYRLLQEVVPALHRVAKRKTSDLHERSAGKTAQQTAAGKGKKSPSARSWSKAQLQAKLQETQRELADLHAEWQTAIKSLTKLFSDLSKTTGFRSFIEQGGLLGASRDWRKESSSDDPVDAAPERGTQVHFGPETDTTLAAFFKA